MKLPYCPNCGAQVTSEANFCPVCKANLKQTPTPQAAERVLCTVSNLKRPRSLGRWDTYSLAVTDRRMIFALLTGDQIKEAIKEAQQKAKSEGKGFMQQWASQMNLGTNYAQRYLGMDPGNIIRENSANFTVDNSLVLRIRIEPKGGRNSRNEYDFDVETAAGKNSFETDGYPNGSDGLVSIFGDKVKASGKGWTIRI